MLAYKKRVATWLDVATAGMRPDDPAQVALHAVGGRDGGCLMVTINRRLLHDSEGRATVFQDLEAVNSFLAVGGLRAPDTVNREINGEVEEAPPIACGLNVRCLRLTPDGRLVSCRQTRRMTEQRGGRGGSSYIRM